MQALGIHPVDSLSRGRSYPRGHGFLGSIFYPPPSLRPQSALERRLAVWFLLAVVWGTAATALGTSTIPLVGKQLTGLVWVVQTALAGLALAFSTRRRIAFPVVAWLPWLIWIVLRCDFADPASRQRTAMLLGGPLVGLCAAAVVSNERELAWMLRGVRVIVLIILTVFILARLNFLPAGIASFGYSPITLCLTAAVLAPHVLAGDRRDTLLWLSCVGMCAWSAFRAPIATCVLTLPLTPSRQSLNKRLLAILCVGILGLTVLAVPQVKNKMLRNSKQDSLQALVRNPEDIYSSGRSFMWRLYLAEAWKQPLVGQGGGTSLAFGMELSQWAHPHCEYIRVFFEYGIVGILLLTLASFHTLVFTFRGGRAAPSSILRHAWTGCCGGFIAMGLLAITGNVILYIAFFGCLLFGLFGATCGASAGAGYTPSLSGRVGEPAVRVRAQRTGPLGSRAQEYRALKTGSGIQDAT